MRVLREHLVASFYQFVQVAIHKKKVQASTLEPVNLPLSAYFIYTPFSCSMLHGI
ncbi:MAG: hypothetical protein ACI85I_001658 [Arenicella sp.]|jgi:hypothetical protein